MTATCSVFLFAGIPHSTTILLLWVFVAVVTIALLAMLYYQVRKHKRLSFEIDQLSGMKRHTVEHEMVLKAMKLVTWRLDAHTHQIVFDSDFRDAPDSYVPQPGITIEEFVKQFSAKDAPIIQKKLIDLCEGRTEEYHEQHQVKASHGDRMYWTESFATIAERDAEGKPSVIVGTAMRIDERKKLETELISARIKAEESDRLKSAFLNNISHEIRTPLNAIMGFAQLMSNDLTEEERNLYNGYILESNNQLLSTLDDIIDVSNMEVGTFNFQFEHTDVDQLCQSQEEAIRELIPDGVCYSYQPLQEGLCLHTDRKRVSQVLFNLLSNACKNTTSGSITLSVAHYIANNSVQFIVTDTGVGVPADKAKKIFEHFEKLDHYSPGLGLGLYVCNLIAQALGGEIYLDTGYTQGARFVFTVPNQPAETEAGDSENNIPS